MYKIWGSLRKSKGLGILVGEEDVKEEVEEPELSLAKLGPLSQSHDMQRLERPSSGSAEV